MTPTKVTHDRHTRTHTHIRTHAHTWETLAVASAHTHAHTHRGCRCTAVMLSFEVGFPLEQCEACVELHWNLGMQTCTCMRAHTQRQRRKLSNSQLSFSVLFHCVCVRTQTHKQPTFGLENFSPSVGHTAMTSRLTSLCCFNRMCTIHIIRITQKIKIF